MVHYVEQGVNFMFFQFFQQIKSKSINSLLRIKQLKATIESIVNFVWWEN